MNTRPAQPSDLEAIVAIYNQAVAAEATADLDPVAVADRREWLEGHAPDRHPVLVAEEAGRILGWASLSPYRPGRRAVRHTAEISYYVHEDHRRRGVASALIRACIDRCPSLGVRTLFAIILADNVASIRLMENLGFREWGRLPRVADFGGREVDHLYYGLRVC